MNTSLMSGTADYGERTRCAASVWVLLCTCLGCLFLLGGETANAGRSGRGKSASGKQRISRYFYVGAWRGYRKGKMGFGTGCAQLIAPNWAITAAHVASRKAKSPREINAQVHFRKIGKGSPVVGLVDKVYLSGLKGDIALLHFKVPVRGVKPVSLLSSPITKKDGTIRFTMAGQRGGLHVHAGRTGKSKDGMGFYMSESPGGGRPGKAGDSGGAWLIPRPKGESHVLFAIIHGGGKGPQVAPNRKRIDELMKPSGQQAKWVTKDSIRKYMKAGV